MWLQLLAGIASFQVLFLIFVGYNGSSRNLRLFLLFGGAVPPYRENHESFSCGEMKNISYPFTLQGSNPSGFPLICDNTTLLLNLTLYYYASYSPSSRVQPPRFQGIYHVNKINIDSTLITLSTIQIADPNFASNDSASRVCLRPRYPIGDVSSFPFMMTSRSTAVTWVMCSKVRGDDGHLDPATYLPLPCPPNNSSSSSVLWHSYLLFNSSMTVAQLDRSCQTVATTPITYEDGDLEGLNLTSIWRHLQMGFKVRLSSLCLFCDLEGGACPAFCYYSENRIDPSNIVRYQLVWLAICGSTVVLSIGLQSRVVAVVFSLITVFGVVPRILGILFVAALLIYKHKKKYSSSDNVEKLLKKCQIHMPRRYSYPEIKIITGHFRDKLGQGGFGSVFKGSLFDGRLVAVKLLRKAKNSGQDFINEVATIGRIHHVNVVRLVGFCSQDNTRALIYEFMSNGSLDKYIFPGNSDSSHLLSWQMFYKIALGIARGIEYLHRGCDVCILHFDIKPHNILLDENFCPKISDFGLAKLSPTQNTVTLSGYRGTIGYIAPEQVSRNFGGVSHKSDVYSFGTLLLQMAGRIKIKDVFAPSSSQFYFPEWIYDRLNEGQVAEISEATEIEKEIIKKLSLVGLCCIQMMPANRPSMGQVIEMLEGSSDDLQLPPKPLLMFSDGMRNSEYSSAPSIWQSDGEEHTCFSESKWSASSSRPLA